MRTLATTHTYSKVTQNVVKIFKMTKADLGNIEQHKVIIKVNKSL